MDSLSYLTENEIVDIVAIKLKSLSFSVISTCNTKEKGIDIIAKKGKYKLLIEAKGATSSIENSKRNGLPFTRNQIRNHISVALYTAMQLLTKYKINREYIIGIALPYDQNHLEFIERVKYAIETFNIAIFWVRDGEVIIEYNDSNKVFILGSDNIIKYNKMPIEKLYDICIKIENEYEELPFKFRGITITKELISSTLEILNMEKNRELPQNSKNAVEHMTPDGLDKRLKQKLSTNIRSANIISDVLEQIEAVHVFRDKDATTGRMKKWTRSNIEW